MNNTEVQTAENLIARKDWPQAHEYTIQFLYDDPDDLRALALMGVIYTEEGQQPAAIKTLEYCLAKGNRSVDVLEAMGCAYLRLKDYAQAETWLDEARRKDPLAASVWRNTGVLYSQTKRPDQSRQAFLRARDLDPADILTLYALASIQLYYGELDEARQTLRALVTLDPPEELRRFALESLARLAHMT